MSGRYRVAFLQHRDHLAGEQAALDLTTASQDTTALGGRAVEAAVRRIEQPGLPPRRVAVEPRLIVRSSTGPPPPGR